MADQELRLNPPPRPIVGYMALAAGLAGIFVPGGAFFVPLALILSLVALFSGHGLWGFVGLFLTATGLLTSPTLLALIGLTAIAAWWS
jgi:hypothetical protein